MKKKYSGWGGVIKLAKDLGYTWQEACKKLNNKNKPKLPLEVDKIIFFCYINNSGLIPASFKL